MVSAGQIDRAKYQTLRNLKKFSMYDHSPGEIYLLINGMADPQNGHQLFNRINQACALTIGQSIHGIGVIGQHNCMTTAAQAGHTVPDPATHSRAACDFATLAPAIDQLPPIGYASGRLGFFIERRVCRSY